MVQAPKTKYCVVKCRKWFVRFQNMLEILSVRNLLKLRLVEERVEGMDFVEISFTVSQDNAKGIQVWQTRLTSDEELGIFEEILISRVKHIRNLTA